MPWLFGYPEILVVAAIIAMLYAYQALQRGRRTEHVPLLCVSTMKV
jgi:hypothetical protein